MSASGVRQSLMRTRDANFLRESFPSGKHFIWKHQRRQDLSRAPIAMLLIKEDYMGRRLPNWTAARRMIMTRRVTIALPILLSLLCTTAGSRTSSLANAMLHRAEADSARGFQSNKKPRRMRRGLSRRRHGSRRAAAVQKKTSPAHSDIQPAMQEDGPGNYRPAISPTPSLEPVFPKVRKKP